MFKYLEDDLLCEVIQQLEIAEVAKAESNLLQMEIFQEVARKALKKLIPMREYCRSNVYVNVFETLARMAEDLSKVIELLQEFVPEEAEEILKTAEKDRTERPRKQPSLGNPRAARAFEGLAKGYISQENPWLSIYNRWLERRKRKSKDKNFRKWGL
jgi:hypothetical protein